MQELKNKKLITKLARWYNLSNELKALKHREQTLRKDICTELFEGKDGSFTVKTFTPDARITAVSKITRSLDKDVLHNITPNLSDEEKSAIRYTPSLVAAVYKKLPVTSKLNEAITEKPAMPTLKVELEPEYDNF